MSDPAQGESPESNKMSTRRQEKSSFFNVRKMIKAVEGLPQLWRYGEPLSKSKEARGMAWDQVAQQIVNGYDQYNNCEKKSIIYKIQHRWKTVRDGYMRKNVKQEYIYGSVMKFLDSERHIHRSMRARRKRDDYCVVEDSSNESVSQEYQPKPVEKKKKEENGVSRLSATSESDEKSDDEEPIVTYPTTDVNDDWAFFQSIMPSVQKMNSYEKLIFRTNIMNLLIAVENQRAAAVASSKVVVLD